MSSPTTTTTGKTCYRLSSDFSTFRLAVESLQFQENVIVEVNSHEEFEHVKQHGLQTLATCKGLPEATYASSSVAEGSALPVHFLSFPSLALTKAETDQILFLLQKDAIVLVSVPRIHSSYEVSCFFAFSPEARNVILHSLQASKLNSHVFNHPFSLVSDYQLPLAFEISQLLGKNRIAVLEATTGGAVANKLLRVPGASRFFISGAVVYTARGAKRILPPSVLSASMMFEQARNYANAENYFHSKLEYCEKVAQLMRTEMKADFCVVESGTAGPDFRVPGVKQAFTVVGVAGPHGFYFSQSLKRTCKDRGQNMDAFTDFALMTLKSALIQFHNNTNNQHSVL